MWVFCGVWIHQFEICVKPLWRRSQHITVQMELVPSLGYIAMYRLMISGYMRIYYSISRALWIRRRPWTRGLTLSIRGTKIWRGGKEKWNKTRGCMADQVQRVNCKILRAHIILCFHCQLLSYPLATNISYNYYTTIKKNLNNNNNKSSWLLLFLNGPLWEEVWFLSYLPPQ